jgi:hypothetical protein
VEGWPAAAVNDAFFAGLLHEVALPVLAMANPEGWRQLGGRGGPDVWAGEDAERAVFGASISRATAYLLGLWGFPEAVVAAIADQPARPGDMTATPAAQVLTLARRLASGPEVQIVAEPTGYLTAERLQRWQGACGELLGAAVG